MIYLDVAVTDDVAFEGDSNQFVPFTLEWDQKLLIHQFEDREKLAYINWHVHRDDIRVVFQFSFWVHTTSVICACL